MASLAQSESLDSSIRKPRTRATLHSLIHNPSQERDSATTDSQSPRAHPRKKARHEDQDDTETTSASKDAMFNKTWNLYRTTPFFHHDQSQYSIYEQELLSFIAANAVNFASSALNPQPGSDTSALINSNRAFPVQIDSAGHNIIETLDHPGDIKSVTFERLILEDPKADEEQGQDQNQDQHPDQSRRDQHKDSLLITLTIRPKGKVKDQVYYCALMLDRTHDKDRPAARSEFTHFNLVFLKTSAVIGQLVLQWLERKFDCRICRLLFQTFELRKIVDSSLEVMYKHAEGRAEKKGRSIELTYALPPAATGLKTITVSLQPDEARQLLMSRLEQSRAGILEGLEEHLSRSMRIDFGRMELTRAGCTAWYIAGEGKAKIFEAIEDRYSLLDLLQSIGRCGT
ncbi:hypothetical protein EMPS_02449 [Entomortierella parvispora]|uniref:Centromere protein L n=1 Tax=Entomortierella parvispora TaxID=205924 RepID=A0A9P3H504_9FUNG|nr:hypothetical protein EMPS_02449 [Entomortierella parvispora]